MPSNDQWPDVRSRVRGLVVGYCLGDALGRAPDAHRSALVAGTPGLVFLSSVEGVVRWHVRSQVTGRPASLADACWEATLRWAHRANRRTLHAVVERAAAGGDTWPDGWLKDLSLLRGGRGSAPAIELALDAPDHDRTPGGGTSDSVGDLVLSRTLPVALAAVAGLTPVATDDAAPAAPEDGGHPVSVAARDVAAATHGIVAQVLAVALTRTLAETLVSGEVRPLVDLPDLSAVYRGVPHTDDVVRARVALRALADLMPPHPRASDDISHGIPSGNRTALGAVREGLRCALAHPGRAEVDGAIADLVSVPHPAAGAVTLALLGAAHGVEALPPDAVARLDVGHVADQLALDLVAEVEGGPQRSPHRDAVEDWLRRYPPG
ncbi:hypothetical protein GXB85_15495 [Cellulomonas sp. APG4]|uniref:hypothetical protein n=1 Tax=Cellulomonas sp. APG4 TaxID=1538656 RepID=UPI001379AEA3|nr:hypothetical protein [Cellulomonas sp. APG4]NCT92343.1 hypothetical protein [Cellulomonas sp. APG4]